MGRDEIARRGLPHVLCGSANVLGGTVIDSELCAVSELY